MPAPALPDTPNQAVAIGKCVTEFTQNSAAPKLTLPLSMAHEVRLKSYIEIILLLM